MNESMQIQIVDGSGNRMVLGVEGDSLRMVSDLLGVGEDGLSLSVSDRGSGRPDDVTEFVTLSEAARLLKVTERYVDRLGKEGKIDSVVLGKERLVSAQSVKEYDTSEHRGPGRRPKSGNSARKTGAPGIEAAEPKGHEAARGAEGAGIDETTDADMSGYTDYYSDFLAQFGVITR